MHRNSADDMLQAGSHRNSVRQGLLMSKSNYQVSRVIVWLGTVKINFIQADSDKQRFLLVVYADF